MNALETGIYDELAGDTALTAELGGTYVYNQAAEQGRARPYVVFAHAGGGHENISPSELIDAIYLIKGVADSLTQAGDVDDLVKAALHEATLTVSGGYTNFHTQREDAVRFQEVLRDGEVIYHAGAYYRFRLDD